MENIVIFNFTHKNGEVSYYCEAEVLVQEDVDKGTRTEEVLDIYIEPVTLTADDIHLTEEEILRYFDAWEETRCEEMFE